MCAMREPHTLTRDETESLEYGEELHSQLECYAPSSTANWGDYNPNRCRIYRVSGKVRRWKRTPTRIEVPVKFGMYGPSDMITQDNMHHYALADRCPLCAQMKQQEAR